MKKRNVASLPPRRNGTLRARRGNAGAGHVRRTGTRLVKHWARRARGASFGVNIGLDYGFRPIRVSVSSAADIVEARRRGRTLAMDLGFDATELTAIASAIAEIARNLVDHAEHGTITLSSIRHNGSAGLSIVASDEGSEIRNSSPGFRQGCAPAQPLGIGIPQATRMMDDFEVRSKPGRGTVVTMKKWLHPAASG